MIKLYIFIEEETNSSLGDKKFTGKVLLLNSNRVFHFCQYQYLYKKINGDSVLIEDENGEIRES